MQVLRQEFYLQTDTVQVARQLLGKVLITRWQGHIASGRIVETEAYLGETDRASHAWAGRRTPRTEIMYGPGGHAYVYLCYGIHQLFNVITQPEGIPHAVLIRALEPLEGIDIMLQRRKKKQLDHSLTRGPGSLAAALGLHTKHTGLPLFGDQIQIADDGWGYRQSKILATPRIGVDYAGEHAAWLLRFIVKDSPCISGTKQQNFS